MPRPQKPPRLWLRSKRGSRPATWIILDGGKHIATGCLAGEIVQSETALSDHIKQKHQPSRTLTAAHAVKVADVLSLYVDDALPRVSEPEKFTRRIERLNGFFGDMTLADVTGATCRRYTAERESKASARRELEDLRSAINYHAKEGLHREIVRVSLPEKGTSRQRWLTRNEAADLLWLCWRYREVQTVHRGPRKGEQQQTKKYPLRHLAKFILIGLYTGSRAGAISSAAKSPEEGRSWVDIERGVFHRLAIGRRRTNKRQPPVRLPDRLLAHMRRWARDPAMEYFVEWRGKPVQSVKTGFGTAARLAGLESVSPHVLRHTAATWLMQAGVPTWEAAGFLGMSEKMLRDVYGHHHPDFQNDAAQGLGYRKRVSLAVSLADGETRDSQRAKIRNIIGGPGRTRTYNQIVMSETIDPETGWKPQRTGAVLH